MYIYIYVYVNINKYIYIYIYIYMCICLCAAPQDSVLGSTDEPQNFHMVFKFLAGAKNASKL